MKRILITGGTGFFGKSMLDYFARHDCGYGFTVLSRHGFAPDFLSQVQQSDNPPIKQFLGDIRSFDLPPDARFDWIIHAATPARADVPDDEMRSIIIDGTANALKQAKKCGAEKFMMVSSGGVYGKGLTGGVSEDDGPHPYTAYGIAKSEAEKMAVDSGLHVLLPRCFAFVGPYLDRNAHFAIGNFIRDALAGEDIVINGDGTPMRSYLYADDLVEWLFAILERGESGRVYNVGSPEAISIKDLAQTVLEVVHGRQSEIANCKSQNGLSQNANLAVGQSNKSAIDRSNNPTGKQSNSQTIRVLGTPVPGAANCYVPNVDRIVSELGVRVQVPLREAILRSCGEMI